jgi:hypothetical protein
MARARRSTLEPRKGRETPAASIQTSLRLPVQAYSRLMKAANRQDRGVGEEIRRRLEASFLQEAQAGDSETYALVQAICSVAQNLEVPFGSWHKNRFAFDVFLEAINALVTLFQPSGDSIRPTNEIAELYLGATGTPQTAGRMLAGGAAAAANITMPGTPKRLEPGAERER